MTGELSPQYTDQASMSCGRGGASDGRKAGAGLGHITPSAPGPSTDGLARLPHELSFVARSLPCVVGALQETRQTLPTMAVFHLCHLGLWPSPSFHLLLSTHHAALSTTVHGLPSTWNPACACCPLMCPTSPLAHSPLTHPNPHMPLSPTSPLQPIIPFHSTAHLPALSLQLHLLLSRHWGSNPCTHRHTHQQSATLSALRALCVCP